MGGVSVRTSMVHGPLFPPSQSPRPPINILLWRNISERSERNEWNESSLPFTHKLGLFVAPCLSPRMQREAVGARQSRKV